MKSKKKLPQILIYLFFFCVVFTRLTFTLFPTGQMQKVIHFSSTQDDLLSCSESPFWCFWMQIYSSINFVVTSLMSRLSLDTMKYIHFLYPFCLELVFKSHQFFPEGLQNMDCISLLNLDYMQTTCHAQMRLNLNSSSGYDHACNAQH